MQPVEPMFVSYSTLFITIVSIFAFARKRSGVVVVISGDFWFIFMLHFVFVGLIFLGEYHINVYHVRDVIF